MQQKTEQSKFMDWMIKIKNIYYNDTERMDVALNNIIDNN